MKMNKEAEEYSAEVTALRKQRMTHRKQESGAFYGGMTHTPPKRRRR